MTPTERQALIDEAVALRERHNHERCSGDRVAMAEIEERFREINRLLNGVLVGPPAPAPSTQPIVSPLVIRPSAVKRQTPPRNKKRLNLPKPGESISSPSSVGEKIIIPQEKPQRVASVTFACAVEELRLIGMAAAPEQIETWVRDTILAMARCACRQKGIALDQRGLLR
jgi:hypothetical protein